MTTIENIDEMPLDYPANCDEAIRNVLRRMAPETVWKSTSVDAHLSNIIQKD